MRLPETVISIGSHFVRFKDMLKKILTDNLVIALCASLTVMLLISGVWSAWFFPIPTKLNEIGDSVAGFASSLAFIWIVGSVFIQRQELASMRSEYESMRETMQAQQVDIRRESGLRITRLYLESLDSIATQFMQKARVMLRSIDALPSHDLDSTSVFSYVHMKCIQIEDRSDTINADLIRNRFSVTLSAEIERYRKVFNKMDLYLKTEPDGELIRHILIESSKYSQVFSLISKDFEQESLAASIYSCCEKSA